MPDRRTRRREAAAKLKFRVTQRMTKGRVLSDHHRLTAEFRQPRADEGNEEPNGDRPCGDREASRIHLHANVFGTECVINDGYPKR